MSYMNRLLKLAQDLSNDEDQVVVYSKLVIKWNDIEHVARTYKWDIFELSASEATLVNLVRDAVELLYKLGGDPAADVEQLRRKNREYGESWCSRGGVGAFMMAARKWDRIVNQVANVRFATMAPKGDVALRVVEALKDARPDGIWDDIGDLRRYLLLWLAWLEERTAPSAQEAFDAALLQPHEDIQF